MKYNKIILTLSVMVLFLVQVTGQENGLVTVHFCPGDCKITLISLINNSKEMYCAFYNVKDKDVISALVKSKAKKLIVTNKPVKGLQTKVKPFYIKGIMHNKFCVFDKEIVYTGSYNPNGLGYLNNVIVINSETVANNYMSEFYELYNNEFGKGKKVKRAIIKLNKTIIETYFCPEDDCQEQVLNQLSNSKSSIRFMDFSFTDEKIASLLIEKSKKINVEGIMESSQLTKYSVYPMLKEDIPIMVYKQGILHDKVFIIDNRTVITGSWNPTKNGSNRNDENVVIIHDNKIAELYLNRYNEIKNKH